MYYELRRKGVTPRSAIDILIAVTAIRYNLSVLHDDHDFDVMAQNIPELKIYGASFQIVDPADGGKTGGPR